MNILALDLGTNTGWAVTREGAIHSGVQQFKPVRFEGGGMRYLKFVRWLDELVLDCLPGWVVFEEVRNHGMAGVDTAHAYGGFMATLTTWCERRMIPYQGVPVGTIKQFWTGKGNSGKPVMIAQARKRGFAATDDNEVDALALLSWAIGQHAAPVKVSVPRRMAKRRD